MRFQAGIQILLIIISVVIVFSVIKPKFSEISFKQNELVTYQAALDNLGQYNQRLQSLINRANSMSAEEKADLLLYLPDRFDAVAIGGDISNVVSNNNLLLLDVEPSNPTLITAALPDAPEPSAAEFDPASDMGPGSPANTSFDSIEPENAAAVPSTAGYLYAQQFKVTAVGTYEQMKTMLKDLERNAYPLRMIEFSFDLGDDNSPLTQYSLTLETYALTSAPLAETSYGSSENSN